MQDEHLGLWHTTPFLPPQPFQNGEIIYFVYINNQYVHYYDYANIIPNWVISEMKIFLSQHFVFLELIMHSLNAYLLYSSQSPSSSPNKMWISDILSISSIRGHAPRAIHPYAAVMTDCSPGLQHRNHVVISLLHHFGNLLRTLRCGSLLFRIPGHFSVALFPIMVKELLENVPMCLCV